MSEIDAGALPYDVAVTTIDGDETTLERWRGHVLLVVNVASGCGLTPQYEGLERLWREHRGRGLVVLGFPCDQFGGQEPGTEAEIREFCSRTYDVTFPLFAKVEVNGPGAHPLFRHLKAASPGLLGTRSVKWNFTKWLVDRDGRVVSRHAPTETPEALEARILGLLDTMPAAAAE